MQNQQVIVLHAGVRFEVFNRATRASIGVVSLHQQLDRLLCMDVGDLAHAMLDSQSGLLTHVSVVRKALGPSDMGDPRGML